VITCNNPTEAKSAMTENISSKQPMMLQSILVGGGGNGDVCQAGQSAVAAWSSHFFS
jgi:hypothetical protein